MQKLLGSTTPDYLHLPVALSKQREKLSKQTFADPLDAKRSLPTLFQVMRFLGQEVPPELADASIEDFWRWAVMHWDVKRVPRMPRVVVEMHGGIKD